MPHVRGWGEYEYQIYAQGQQRCSTLLDVLGHDGFDEMVNRTDGYASNDLFGGEDVQRTAFSSAFMVMGAMRGVRPDHTSNRKGFIALRAASVATVFLQMNTYAENMAQITGIELEALPRQLPTYDYDALVNEVTVMTNAAARDELEEREESPTVEGTLLISAGQPTFVLRSLLLSTVASGNKDHVAGAQKTIKGLINNFPYQSSRHSLLTRAMLSRERDYKPLVPTVRVLGDELSDAFRDFAYQQALSKAEQAARRVLGMKRPAFTAVRDRVRESIAYAAQPDTRYAFFRMMDASHDQACQMVDLGRAPQSGHEQLELSDSRGTDPATPASEAAPVDVPGKEAPDDDLPALVEGSDHDVALEQLAAMVDQWSDMEILGESRHKSGLKQAAEKLEREIAALREEGQKVPPLDMSRLQMLANLKALWPGSQIVSGIFTGRRKQHTESADVSEAKALKSYIALVMPIIENGQHVGDNVVGECLVKDRHATYFYSSRAGGGKHWTEVFGPEKKGVNGLPGVKVIPHNRVGSRTATQATFEKLCYLLVVPHDQYDALNFSGEHRDGSLRVQLGNVAVRNIVRLGAAPEESGPSAAQTTAE